jgi:hypothetical protein
MIKAFSKKLEGTVTADKSFRVIPEGLFNAAKIIKANLLKKLSSNFR